MFGDKNKKHLGKFLIHPYAPNDGTDMYIPYRIHGTGIFTKNCAWKTILSYWDFVTFQGRIR